MTDEAQALLQSAGVATHHINDGVSALPDMVEGMLTFDYDTEDMLLTRLTRLLVRNQLVGS
jgi:hypothetical protein